MYRSIPIFLALLLLAGCSTIMDRSTQDITIETPGASGALCILHREGYRDRIWAPRTVRVQKADEPLRITCRAPGNREKTLVIEPTISPNARKNAINGLIGMAYDYETSAMFLLPEKVVVDFTAMKPTSMPKPDYQEVLDANPDILRLEQFFPGAAAMNQDKTYRQPVLEPRKMESDFFGDSAEGEGGEEFDNAAGSLGEYGPPAPAETKSGGIKAEKGGVQADKGGAAVEKGGIPDFVYPTDQLPALNQ